MHQFHMYSNDIENIRALSKLKFETTPVIILIIDSILYYHQVFYSHQLYCKYNLRVVIELLDLLGSRTHQEHFFYKCVPSLCGYPV